MNQCNIIIPASGQAQIAPGGAVAPDLRGLVPEGNIGTQAEDHGNIGKLENLWKTWEIHGKLWKMYGQLWKIMEKSLKTWENYGKFGSILRLDSA